MPVVNYKEARIHTVSCKGASYRFIPGMNEVPNDVWDKLNAKDGSPGCKNLVSRRVLEPLNVNKPAGKRKTAPKPVEKVEDITITAMNKFDALDLIENTFDVGVLERFLTEEKGKEKPRKDVVDALEKQLKAHKDPQPLPDE